MMGHWNSNHLNNFSKTNDDCDEDDDDKKTMMSQRNCSDCPVVVDDDDFDCCDDNLDGSGDDFVDDVVVDSNDKNSMTNSMVTTEIRKQKEQNRKPCYHLHVCMIVKLVDQDFLCRLSDLNPNLFDPKEEKNVLIDWNLMMNSNNVDVD